MADSVAKLPVLRIIFCLVLFEFCLFIFSGVSFAFLSHNSFFNIEIDPLFWIVYVLHIPQFIIAHHWLGIGLDALTILLLLVFVYNPFNHKIALILLVLLALFYITLMGYLTHRNYQVGFVIVFIPFIFKKDLNRYFAYEGTRYFLLLFYVSSAFLKIFNNALADPEHLSNMISGQFTPYYLENNTGFRTDLNLYLINHATTGHGLFLLSVLVEMVPLAGFFTRRFDKYIAGLLLLFHFTNWLIMDIAPFGQLSFICLLFISKYFSNPRKL